MLFEQQYLSLMLDVISHGQDRLDYSGAKVRSIFGKMLTVDLNREFPILITNYVDWDQCLRELLWMLSGNTNIKRLREQGIHTFDSLADKNGDLGPTHGFQWRRVLGSDQSGFVSFQEDQLGNAIKSLQADPFSTRHVVSAWNVTQVSEMRLLPTDYVFQFYVDYTDTSTFEKPNYRLNCILLIRSSNLPVNLPSTVVNYSALLIMIAKQLGYYPGELKLAIGDSQVYEKHIDLIMTQNKRIYKNFRNSTSMSDDYLDRRSESSSIGKHFQENGLAYPLYGNGPKFIIKQSFKGTLNSKIEDFNIIDYNPIKPYIDYQISV